MDEPRDLILTKFELLQNILKMGFCRAFKSLPGKALGRFFGSAAHSDVGSNNLPPIFSGGHALTSLRAKYSEHSLDSLDSDISVFPAVRKTQAAVKERSTTYQSKPLLRSDYRQPILQLMEENYLDPDSFASFVHLVTRKDMPATSRTGFKSPRQEPEAGRTKSHLVRPSEAQMPESVSW